jgi:hypothetical protein
MGGVSMIFALAAAAAAVTAQPDPRLEFVMEATVTLSDRISTGKTVHGGRGFTPITGGTFHGKGIGGEIKADYFWKTDDGVIINILNTGVACMNPDGSKPDIVYTRPVFEVPVGKYAWLGQVNFVGTLEAGSSPDGQRAVKLRFFAIR